MKHKNGSLFKRSVSALLSVSFLAGMVTLFPVSGAEVNSQSIAYPYALFAENENTDNGIEVNSENLTLNGSCFTNGAYNITSETGNINGDFISSDDNEEAKEDDCPEDLRMIYLHSKITGRYFVKNCHTYSESTRLAEMNLRIDEPVYVKGSLDIEGNNCLNASIGAITDITVTGDNLNCNNAAIYSKFGSIKINSKDVSVNGIIYAPFGTVDIDCTNFNINGLIIAQKIIINGSTVNVNYSRELAEFVGTRSEAISWSFDDFKYLNDTDRDFLPDPIEKAFGSDPLIADTDGDTLPDGNEVIVFGTSPVKKDTNTNGIMDNEEDFDADGLINGLEYLNNTDPFESDTDGDTLKDGEEVNVYYTDPLRMDTDSDGLDDADEVYFNTDPNLVDTDGNGVSDGEEKRSQVLVYKSENLQSAVTEVKVAFDGTGNINRNTEIKSVLGKDELCSNVVGLVGEPFSIETSSHFDKATLTFTIDKSKLSDTAFDDLLFLWHDEENHNFEELETFYDAENSQVFIKTNHFSRYMVVDRNKWFEAWSIRLNYNPNKEHPSAPNLKYNTVLAIDCSGSMSSNDPFISNNGSSSSTCERISASAGFINNINSSDRAAVVLFDNYAQIVQGLTSDKDALISALSHIRNSGGTNFDQAITKSVSVITSDHNPSINGEDRIILLSDGESSIKTATLDLAKNNHIKIHTVGLGTYSDDDLLKKIADYTGGTFYKALKADELIEIYTEIGFNDDFDRTDTDGDGLYDAVEAAGIRIENGTIIKGCDPTLKDTDGDGIDDGLEIDPQIKKKDARYYPSAVPEQGREKIYYFAINSNPTLKDSDNDGLADGYITKTNSGAEYVIGNRVYDNEKVESLGEIIAPVDVEPLKYNGPEGMWKKHIDNVKHSNIPTQHTHWYGLSESVDFIGPNNILYDEVQYVVSTLNSTYNIGCEGPAMVLPVLLVALCLKYPDLVTEIGSKLQRIYNNIDLYRIVISNTDPNVLYDMIRDYSVTDVYEIAINWMKNNVASTDENEAREICAALGAAFLNFKADDNEVVHSQYHQWQDIGGFNNFYDYVFEWATEGNMRREKFAFTEGDTDYIFWLWRGNYINLGAGCEIGIYKRSSDSWFSGGEVLDHYFCDVDLSMPMNLCLYNYNNSSDIENIFSWDPDPLQWWVTGFNPAYAGNVDAAKQVSVGTIDMSDKTEMFDAMYNTYKGNDYVYFDAETHTVFFMWCAPALLNIKQTGE